MNAKEYRDKFLAMFPGRDLPKNIIFYWLYVWYCRSHRHVILLERDPNANPHYVLAHLTTVLSRIFVDIGSVFRGAVFVALAWSLYTHWAYAPALCVVLIAATLTQAFLPNENGSVFIARVFEKKVHTVDPDSVSDLNAYVTAFAKAMRGSKQRKWYSDHFLRMQIRESVATNDFPVALLTALQHVDTPVFADTELKQIAMQEVRDLRWAAVRSFWIDYLWATFFLVMCSYGWYPDMSNAARVAFTVGVMSFGYLIVVPAFLGGFFLRTHDDLIEFLKTYRVSPSKNSMIP